MRNLRYITLLIFAALLAACGPDSPAESLTLSPAERQPTLNAQFTQFALTGTPPAQDPALAATLSTPLSEEQFAEALQTPESALSATGTTTPLAAAEPTPTPADTGGALSARQVASGGIDYGAAVPPVTPRGDLPGALTGGDRYATTIIDSLAYGETVEEVMPTDIEGHNWQFLAEAGDSVTITVTPTDGGDPRVKLIGPGDALLATTDSGGDGGTEIINATLEAGGVYTVRIDMWNLGGGTYQLTVTN